MTGTLSAGAEGAAALLIIPLVSSLGDGEVLSGLPVGFVADYFDQLSPRNLLVAVAVTLVIVWGLRSVLLYLNTVLAIRLQFQVDGEWKRRVHGDMLRMDFGTFTRHERGTLLTLLTFNSQMSGRVVQLTMQQVLTLSLGGMYLAGLLLVSWQLTAIGITAVIVQSRILSPLNRFAKRAGERQRQSMNAINSISMETLDGQREIRVFSQEQRVESEFGENIANYKATSSRVQAVNAVASPAFIMLTMVSVAAVMVSSSFFLSKLGDGWIAVLLVYLFFAFRMSGVLGQVNQARATIAGSMPAVDRLLEFVDDRTKITMVNGSVSQGVVERGIELRDVTFQYDPDEAPVLNAVDFTIPRGRISAIVGASGAGKSTLAGLLMRLYDPQQGAVLVDDVDIRELDIQSWRKRVGIVSQDNFIFNDTVRNNIAFGYQDASDDDVKSAAEKAEAVSFIESLPQGYETRLGDRGVRLSGGQRQRIALARSLIANPDVIVMDEATSALDAQTETAIMESVHRLKTEHTIVVIAHRWSTIRGADNIIVLEDGEKVEEGDHESLMAMQRKYYEMVRIQLSEEDQS